MKQIILVALITLVASSAFATHAYLTQDCLSDTHKLVYQGNYPIGGSYGLSKLQSEDQIKVWDIDGEEENETVSLEENVFKVVESKILSSEEVKASCEGADGVAFEETNLKSEITIKLLNVLKADEAKSGLKTGDTMKLLCDETFAMPVRCE